MSEFTIQDLTSVSGWTNTSCQSSLTKVQTSL